MNLAVATLISRRAFKLFGPALLFAFSMQYTLASENWHNASQTGGSLTVYSFGESPYNHAAPFLQLEDRRKFSDGATAFRKKHALRSVSGVEDRLEITYDFNARSCESCHVSDGRGISFAEEFEQTGLSAKSSSKHSDVPVFRKVFHGSPSQRLESVVWDKVNEIKLADGTIVELVAPSAIVDGVKGTVDLRNAPGVYGLGLLEAIPVEDIINLAKLAGFAKFGVKGIVAPACDHQPNGNCLKVGRFGWKATVADLDAQTRSALANELGIHEPGQDSSRDFKLDYDTLVADLTDYVRVLAVPARQLDGETGSLRGAQLFEETGCTMCHRPSWRTGQGKYVNEHLRNQLIYPFTDLLLHDMGEGLADRSGEALAQYWRTPALWGIGMQNIVSNKVGYLHDGRARNFTEAILWHGGEAAYSTSRFTSLSNKDRSQLIEFLNSL